jgi:CheY-like chemotaxis protein
MDAPKAVQEVPASERRIAFGMVSVHHPPASPVRVLLVDDHDDSLRLLAKLLGLNGYGVETARSAAEAVEVASAASFDVVICDLMLPDRSGFELLEDLQRSSARPGLRGIALSGMTDPATVTRCETVGFARHLCKPVNMDDLLDAVRAVTAGGPPGGGFDAGSYAGV